MQLVDTHCHVHFPDYPLVTEEVTANASQMDVAKLICVGCSLEDSILGVGHAQKYENIWASIGLHPHEAKQYVSDDAALQRFRVLASQPRVVAVGETGLDYYYNHSNKDDQEKLLRFQLKVAAEHKLPLIFHVRDAFDDFWKVIDEFNADGAKIRGVIHSFSAGEKELGEILERGLYVGLNGIMTFTKQQEQLEAAKAVPLDKLLLETDAPFLTPTPYRGTICEPKHVRVTAEFLANLRGESLEELAAATTHNATRLFGLHNE